VKYNPEFLFIPFLSDSPTGQTVRQLLTLNRENDADSHKGVPFLTLVDIAAYYRPRSTGDNTFGSVRVCACVSVRLWALSCLHRLNFDLDFWREDRP